MVKPSSHRRLADFVVDAHDGRFSLTDPQELSLDGKLDRLKASLKSSRDPQITNL
jgi:hypothetical protein